MLERLGNKPVKRLAMSLIGTLSAFFVINANAEYGLNLQPPATEIAGEILTLHNLILLICLIIFLLVFAVMFYSLFAHRKSRGVKPATFHHSTALEIIWTVIPILILLGMAIPSTATLIKMEDTTEADMTLKITGYQWFWQYEYLDDNINFYSKLSTPRAQIEGREPKGENYLLEVDREVVLPVGKKVKLLITAADVIHAWWIPTFGVKKDAIPGYLTESWVKIDEPGVYRGQCAELCGKDHGYMPIVVRAVTEQEYQQWVQENQQVEETAQLDTEAESATEQDAAAVVTN